MISLKADSHFVIGAGHVVCQDYALHGSIPTASYVMGADGCSSSPKSELGARLICEAARKILEVNGWLNVDVFRNSLLQELRQLKTMLRLDSRNFDATFWMVLATASGTFILGWGDGVVRREFTNGDVWVDHVEFTSGAPRYLSYALDGDRYKQYLLETKGKPVILTSIANDKTETSEHEVDSFYFFEDMSETGYDLKTVAIMSDGINTFKERNGTVLLPFGDMVAQLCDFVNVKGVFVERQMKWFLKETQKKDIIHVDDLFCAALSYENIPMSDKDKALLAEALASLKP